MNNLLLGENIQLDEIYKDQVILSSLKYAPTSVNIKQSFSIYKHSLTDKSRIFTEKKLEYGLINNFNNKE